MPPMAKALPATEVPVAAGVVEVVAANAGRDVVDARVVQQGTEILAPIREGEDTGALLAIVRVAVMTTTVSAPNSFKLVDDLVDAVRQEPGEVQNSPTCRRVPTVGL